MAITITKKTNTANTTASSGRSIKYIVEHYTAGITSKSGQAANVASWFSNLSAGASADFIVDDANIVQYNPDPKNRYCWAVGGSKYSNKGGSLYGVAKNANCISIEICSTNSQGKVTNANDKYWSFTDAVIANAVALTKYLMDLYGIDADHVIRHYDVNGKPCPGIIGWNADSGDESAWKAFKAQLTGASAGTSTGTSGGTTGSKAYYRVRKTWADASSQIGAFESLDNAKKCADANSGYYVFDENGNAVYPTTSASTALTVDGTIGPATVKRLQAVLGTTQDSKISGQNSKYKSYWTSISSSVCSWNGGTSAVVKALQKKIGVTQDGSLGPNTAKALQTYLIGKGYSCGSSGADGYFGTNSAKALQKWLNAQ